MDKIERYRQIVRDLINEYAAHKPSNGQIETEAIIDSDRDHYEVVHVGWDGYRRVHGSIIHIDIRGGKVWLQHNGTNQMIAQQLVEAGVPKDDIILGFHPEQLRQHTGYGVG